jgi:hypothetical protein
MFKNELQVYIAEWGEVNGLSIPKRVRIYVLAIMSMIINGFPFANSGKTLIGQFL